jgi:RNA polymerase sigma-70 factor (ECF subfamily)
MANSLLYQAYKDNESALLRFLFQRLGSAPLAHDLAQDICVKILEMDPPANVDNRRAYLFRMAANLATDHMRGETRRAELLAQAARHLTDDDAVASPEQATLANQELKRVKSAIAELSDLDRRIFLLTRFEGKSQREIAALVGLSPTAVFKRLRTIMDRLAVARDG